MRVIPAEVQAEVEALRGDGWVPVEEAVESTGRSFVELATLWESGEATFRAVGHWWSDNGVPCNQMLVHLATLEVAPRRTPLRLIKGGAA